MTRRSFMKALASAAAVMVAAPTLAGRKLMELAEQVKPVALVASHDPMWDQMYGMHDVLKNSNTYGGIDRRAGKVKSWQ